MSALCTQENVLDRINGSVLFERLCVQDETVLLKFFETYIKSTDNHETFLHDCLKSKVLKENDRVSCIEMCIELGIYIDCTDQDGKTPLIMAVIARSLDCVKTLLSVACGINKVDNSGKTALHYCFLGPYEAKSTLINVLIEHGANVNIPDSLGITPAYYALLSNAKILRLITLAYGDVTSFRQCHFYTLNHVCGWKVRTMDIQVFLKRLYYLGCPVTCCKTIAEMYPKDISIAKWKKGLTNNCKSLQECCRTSIRRCVGNMIEKRGEEIPVPNAIRQYVLMMDALTNIE
ncbi:hypothetical protein SNE40_015207 [Patella caerulea]|uniref:SOCS box domain-containing protein n=1 Tax=Patella caerulea TaxID=87958 RepID=A0AAN8PUT4_PATCE